MDARARFELDECLATCGDLALWRGHVEGPGGMRPAFVELASTHDGAAHLDLRGDVPDWPVIARGESAVEGVAWRALRPRRGAPLERVLAALPSLDATARRELAAALLDGVLGRLAAGRGAHGCPCTGAVWIGPRGQVYLWGWRVAPQGDPARDAAMAVSAIAKALGDANAPAPQAPAPAALRAQLRQSLAFRRAARRGRRLLARAARSVTEVIPRERRVHVQLDAPLDPRAVVRSTAAAAAALLATALALVVW